MYFGVLSTAEGAARQVRQPALGLRFTFLMTTPYPDAFPFQWRMVQDLVEWFGPQTPPVSITVTAP